MDATMTLRQLGRGLGLASALVLLGSSAPVRAELPASLIVTAPEPLRVWIGARFVGRTPCALDSIAPGETSLLLLPDRASTDSTGIQNEVASAWAAPWRESIALRPGRRDSLELPRLGLVRVRSVPGSALVTLAGRELGRTPVAAYLPRERGLELTIVAPTGETETRAVRFDQDARLDLSIQFPSRASSIALAPAEPPRLGWQKRAQLTLPLAALTSGAFGVWARHQADTAYDDYLATLDRDAQRDSFARAKRWDRVAAGCWIGAEACLAAAAWAWLHPAENSPIRASIDPGGGARLSFDLKAVLP